jgi:peptide chain release factor 1
MEFLDKLEQIQQQFEKIEERLSEPDVASNRELYQKLAKERADLSELAITYRRYKSVLAGIAESKELLHDEDAELRDLASKELESLEAERIDLEQKLRVLILPRDPNDDKNVLLEIRAGTGGDEAALFASDLFRMYSKFAERKGWRVEIMSHHPTGVGGFKEIIAMIEGKGAYSQLKLESGAHRVQRVPVTEAQGRIHTSAVTVAVLPEAEEVEVDIKPEELRIDVYRSSGPGGQSVNTTDSAVRITHLPSGMVVTIQDEKSQHKNKAKALKVLRTRLQEHAMREQQEQISRERKTQVGSGDRSERIRTYNFPQGRVTDHRINLTVYRLEQILQGELEPLLEPLFAKYQADQLA